MCLILFYCPNFCIFKKKHISSHRSAFGGSEVFESCPFKIKVHHEVLFFLECGQCYQNQISRCRQARCQYCPRRQQLRGGCQGPGDIASALQCQRFHNAHARPATARPPDHGRPRRQPPHSAPPVCWVESLPRPRLPARVFGRRCHGAGFRTFIFRVGGVANQDPSGIAGFSH